MLALLTEVVRLLGTADLEVLAAEIESDKAAGRLPCAVLATFGTSPDQPYQCDNLAGV